jgi:hypothetical protein
MEQIIICNRNGDALDVELLYGVSSNKSIYTVDKGYVPAQGDSVFLMPGVNIPRVKLKDLALNLGVKIVRDATRANVIISGKATMNKITTGRWLHNTDTEEFTKYVNRLKDDFGVDNYYIDKYDTAVLACNPDVIYMEYGTKNHIFQCGYNVTDAYSSAVHFVEDEYREMLDNIQNKPIFDESELLAMINGDDAVTITPEVYSQLVKMFESSDQDNHIMAMEIMANSNYIDSALYLLLLLEGYSDKIGDCHTRNHVNFKSMVSYFTLAVKEISWLDPDKIAKKLVSLTLLTKDWNHVLLQERAEWFIRNIAHSTTFNVSALVPTPEIQAAINDSYTGVVEYKPNSKDVASVIELSILPEREVESEEEERVADTEMEAVFTEEQDEAMGKIIAELEESNELPAPPDEIIIELEPESNNHQIETNESTDIDWF